MRSFGLSSSVVVLILVGIFYSWYLFEQSTVIKSVTIGEVTQKVDPDKAVEMESIQKAKKNQIMFFGDIMLARDVELHMIRYGLSYPFSSIQIDKDLVFAVANFESAVPNPHIFTPYNTFRFSTNWNYLSELNSAGFTHVSLANNHSFDYGLAGYNNTVYELWEAEVEPFGHPTILSTSSVTIVDTAPYTVAIVAIHTLFTTPSNNDIEAIFDFAASKSDIQIAFIHWGEEYELTQSAKQRKLAEVLIAAGADVVIGHHPHVVQGIEIIDDVPVFYSLGNFIFDQYFSSTVQTGLVLNLVLDKEPHFELLPVSSLESKARPYYMNASSTEDFLYSLGERSTDEIKEELLAGTISLRGLLASSSEVVIMAE